jgi:hypothetical protein
MALAVEEAVPDPGLGVGLMVMTGASVTAGRVSRVAKGVYEVRGVRVGGRETAARGRPVVAAALGEAAAPSGRADDGAWSRNSPRAANRKIRAARPISSRGGEERFRSVIFDLVHR